MECVHIHVGGVSVSFAVGLVLPGVVDDVA